MPRRARGSIRQRGHGIWQVSTPRPDGGRNWYTVRGTKREAEDYLLVLLRDQPGGSKERRTVGELIRDWFAVAELADTTRTDYERVVADHLPHDFARKKIDRVTAFDIDAAYREMSAAGVTAHRIRRLHQVLRSSFAQAVKWQWVARNPAVDATPPKITKPDIRPPAPDAVRDALARAPVELKMWIRLAAATGARRGELCGLRWGDVEGRTLWIRRSVAYTPRTGVFVKDTKTHQARKVALDAATVEALNVYRASRLKTDPDCYLFSGEPDASEPWRPDSTGRKVSRLTGGAIHPHALRHFVASQLMAAGHDVRTISERLGHERVSTTLDMYSHAVDGTGQQAADHLASLLD